jgi:hypothetical protein
MSDFSGQQALCNGFFNVNLELPFSGLTWKMKYQFVLETGK